jgi:ATP-dependent DNA ligase
VTATASPVFDRRATDTPLYAFDLLELNGQDLRHDSRCARRRWRGAMREIG